MGFAGAFRITGHEDTRTVEFALVKSWLD